MDLLSIATDPTKVMDKYVDVAVKQGTRMLIVQVAVFGLMSFFITDMVVRKYVKGKK